MVGETFYEINWRGEYRTLHFNNLNSARIFLGVDYQKGAKIVKNQQKVAFLSAFNDENKINYKGKMFWLTR